MKRTYKSPEIDEYKLRISINTVSESPIIDPDDTEDDYNNHTNIQ